MAREGIIMRIMYVLVIIALLLPLSGCLTNKDTIEINSIKKLESINAPTPIGPYSQGIAAGDFVFVSGQIPIQKSGELVTNDIEKATEVILDNIEAILKEDNLSLKDVVKCDIYLKDLDNFDKFNKVYEKKFTSEIKPARVTIQVSRLPKNADIEISCIAYRSRK